MYGVTRLDVCEDIALVTFRKIPLNLGLITEIFARFADHDINIDMVSQTAPVGDHISISFTCSDADIREVLDISRGLRDKYPQASSMVSSGNCKIHIFGEEMRTTPGVFARALSAMAGIGAELQQITTSEVDISFLVSAALVEPAAQALRETFELAEE